MKAEDLIKDHTHHHHVHTCEGLIRVGHLAGVLQTVHEGFQLDVAPFERIGQASLCAFNKEFSQNVDFPLTDLL